MRAGAAPWPFWSIPFSSHDGPAFRFVATSGFFSTARGLSLWLSLPLPVGFLGLSRGSGGMYFCKTKELIDANPHQFNTLNHTSEGRSHQVSHISPFSLLPIVRAFPLLCYILRRRRRTIGSVRAPALARPRGTGPGHPRRRGAPDLRGRTVPGLAPQRRRILVLVPVPAAIGTSYPTPAMPYDYDH